MEYQTIVGSCGGVGAGGDGKDDRNKRPVSKAGGRHNHRARLTCPRCHSTNTKFCYYNNYSLSQPRHFCKGCKRFWTQGGTLRNIPPVGGKRRQSRRSCSRVESVAVSATHRSSRSRRRRPASLSQQPSSMPLSMVVPPTIVFPNNGNMRHFRRQNDVNSSSSLTPLTISSNTMRNNELLRGFDEIPIPTNHVMDFYLATAGPVLGDSLNVGNDILPLLAPQPEVDDDNDNNNNNHHEINNVEDNNGEHNILDWANYMGTGGFDEA